MVQCVEGYLDDGQVTGKLENEMWWWSKPKRRWTLHKQKIGLAMDWQWIGKAQGSRFDGP